MTHCYKYKSTKGLWKLLLIKTKRFYFNVPIFLFYFSEKTLSSSKFTKKHERFDRLYIPYLLWLNNIIFI